LSIGNGAAPPGELTAEEILIDGISTNPQGHLTYYAKELIRFYPAKTAFITATLESCYGYLDIFNTMTKEKAATDTSNAFEITEDVGKNLYVRVECGGGLPNSHTLNLPIPIK